MQLTEQNYWELIDETLDLLQEIADDWQQLIWQSMREASIVGVGEDYPSIEDTLDNIRDEWDDRSKQLAHEMKSIKRRAKSQLINDGKAEFSIKWEDED